MCCVPCSVGMRGDGVRASSGSPGAPARTPTPDATASDDGSLSGARPLLLGKDWFAERAGGLNRYFGDLVTVLSPTPGGVSAVVVGPADDAPLEVKGAGRGSRPLPLRLVAFARAASRAGGDVDVVDAHFALYACIPLAMTRLRHLPLVVHFHGPWAEESEVSGPQSRLAGATKLRIERRVYRRADALVVLSHAFKTVLVDRYEVSPGRVHVIPPMVDLQHFRPGDRTVARRRLRLPDDGLVAVVTRRLEPRMGLEVLLEAWSHVLAARDDAVLVIVGEGALRASLAQQVISQRMEGRVVFLGRATDDELLAALHAADVSVVPSIALEGFGLVVLESLATGTPVVSTDVGGLPEAMHGLEGANVVAANDPRLLSTAILAIAAGRGPSPASCRQHAEGFSAATFASRHEELYAEVAGRNIG